MLVISPSINVHIYNMPTDMRKSFHGLALIVHDLMQHDPANGSMYVFWNKKRNKIKILQWERNGFWLHYKNLAKDKFSLPDFNNTAGSYNGNELHYLLEGLSIVSSGNKMPKKMF